MILRCTFEALSASLPLFALSKSSFVAVGELAMAEVGWLFRTVELGGRGGLLLGGDGVCAYANSVETGSGCRKQLTHVGLNAAGRVTCSVFCDSCPAQSVLRPYSGSPSGYMCAADMWLDNVCCWDMQHDGAMQYSPGHSQATYSPPERICGRCKRGPYRC